jgi:hypothetical protein
MNPTPWEEPAGLALQVADALFTLPTSEWAAAAQHLAGVDPSAALESLLAAILQAGATHRHASGIRSGPAGRGAHANPFPGTWLPHDRGMKAASASGTGACRRSPAPAFPRQWRWPADMPPGKSAAPDRPRVLASTGTGRAAARDLARRPGKRTAATGSPPRRTPPDDPRAPRRRGLAKTAPSVQERIQAGRADFAHAAASGASRRHARRRAQPPSPRRAGAKELRGRQSAGTHASQRRPG